MQLDEDREVAPHRSRKDRKRWCRGKVGKEHAPTWQFMDGYSIRGITITPMNYACTSCGKHLDHWYPPIKGTDGRLYMNHGPQPKLGSNEPRSKKRN